MIVEQSTMLGPGDLLIATSFRPYAQQTADIVEEAAKRGAKIMAISDSRLSPIARRAELCFEVKDAEFRKFRSLTASLCLAQTLVISYAFQVTAGDSAGKP
jgi:DNA-binding MurR/RpiR family transcriptional regulator